MMILNPGLLPFALLLILAGPAPAAEKITAARYEIPVERYGHFALGRPHEYARLTAATGTGRKLALQLPEDEVFEDLAPQPADHRAGGRPPCRNRPLRALRTADWPDPADFPARGIGRRALRPPGRDVGRLP